MSDDAFVEFVLEQMALFGDVTAKKMFGGHGLFLDGLMFAIVLDDTLYLKVDDQSRQQFIDRELEPFVYIKQGKPVTLSYYQAPETVFEDREEMESWAGVAWEAARRKT